MSPASKISPLNFHAAEIDVYYAAHGGLFRHDYHNLLIELLQLSQSTQAIPPAYQSGVVRPFTTYLKSLGFDNFNRLFSTHEHQLTSHERSQKSLIQEVAEALLQLVHAQKHNPQFLKDLKAFQAVISTMYMELLDSRIAGVAARALPPLAKWGSKQSPHTYHFQQGAAIGIQAGIVSLPAQNRFGGLLSWVSLGHEVAGHNLLHAFDNSISNNNNSSEATGRLSLIGELQVAIRNAPITEKPHDLREYWSVCAEETASDVLGALMMGPSFGVGLIGYLRGIRGGKLSAEGPFHMSSIESAKNALLIEGSNFQLLVEGLGKDVSLKNSEGFFGRDPINSSELTYKRFNSTSRHPLDILRPYVVAAVIDQVDAKSPWAKQIEDEASKDFENGHMKLLKLNSSTRDVKIEETFIPQDAAISSAKKVAQVILNTKLKCLNEQTLKDILIWSQKDESSVQSIRSILKGNDPKLPLSRDNKGAHLIRPRHILAASVFECLEKDPNIDHLFVNMKKLLFQAYENEVVKLVNEYAKTI